MAKVYNKRESFQVTTIISVGGSVDRHCGNGNPDMGLDFKCDCKKCIRTWVVLMALVTTTGQTSPRVCLATSWDTFPCLVVEGELSTLSRLGDLPGSCENMRQSRIGRLGVTILRQPVPGSQ